MMLIFDIIVWNYNGSNSSEIINALKVNWVIFLPKEIRNWNFAFFYKTGVTLRIMPQQVPPTKYIQGILPHLLSLVKMTEHIFCEHSSNNP